MRSFECVFFFCCLAFLNLIWAKIDIVRSDFGLETCNDDKVKILGLDFYENSCGGKNLLPYIEWLDHNSTTKSYLITLTSAIKPTITVHFLAWNIPAFLNTISDSTRFQDIGAVVGLNSYNKRNYIGPCFKNIYNNTSECMKFTLYSLNVEHIDLSEDADYYEVMAYLKSMSRVDGIVIDQLSLYSIFTFK
ncbi:phosphatidylethanolamine-binding protein, putative [Hepatocystis sp. ex Piliocolobus tephrosceles]|nr:phosphatidylethanolamine-binding protein, putative [Hepatocystis sp. ex Piliocolobus tephrosceles]